MVWIDYEHHDLLKINPSRLLGYEFCFDMSNILGDTSEKAGMNVKITTITTTTQ